LEFFIGASVFARLLLVCVLACIVAASADPPRPKLAEVFETQFTIHLTKDHVSIFGSGWWAVNQPIGMGNERLQYAAEHKHHNIHHLQRYDNGTVYTTSHDTGTEKCVATKVTGPMPSIWEWVATAKYEGKKKVGDRTYDLWGTVFAENATISLAVNETNANHPVFFEQKHQDEHMELHFHRYEQKTPSPREFDIPEICKKPEYSIPFSELVASPARAAPRLSARAQLLIQRR